MPYIHVHGHAHVKYFGISWRSGSNSSGPGRGPLGMLRIWFVWAWAPIEARPGTFKTCAPRYCPGAGFQTNSTMSIFVHSEVGNVHNLISRKVRFENVPRLNCTLLELISRVGCT